MALISIALSSIVIGYEDSVSFSTLSMYDCTPLESDMINAIPMIPMLPANAVRKVLAFLVIRLFRLRESAVRKDIDG